MKFILQKTIWCFTKGTREEWVPLSNTIFDILSTNSLRMTCISSWNVVQIAFTSPLREIRLMNVLNKNLKNDGTEKNGISFLILKINLSMSLRVERFPFHSTTKIGLGYFYGKRKILFWYILFFIQLQFQTYL